MTTVFKKARSLESIIDLLLMDSFIEDSVFDPEVSIICLLPIVVQRKLGYADTSLALRFVPGFRST